MAVLSEVASIVLGGFDGLVVDGLVVDGLPKDSESLKGV